MNKKDLEKKLAYTKSKKVKGKNIDKSKKDEFDRYTDTLLYLAARNEHIKKKIIPALRKKFIVIHS